MCEPAAVALIPVAVSSGSAGDLPAEGETTAYFVVAEALSNLAEHAAAGAGTLPAVAPRKHTRPVRAGRRSAMAALLMRSQADAPAASGTLRSRHATPGQV